MTNLRKQIKYGLRSAGAVGLLLEAQGDTWGGFLDVLFVGVGDSESRPNIDLKTDNDTTSMDLALVWSPNTERMTGVELYGGLRYVDNDFHIVDLESGGGTDLTVTMTGPAWPTVTASEPLLWDYLLPGLAGPKAIHATTCKLRES